MIKFTINQSQIKRFTLFFKERRLYLQFNNCFTTQESYIQRIREESWKLSGRSFKKDGTEASRVHQSRRTLQRQVTSCCQEFAFHRTWQLFSGMFQQISKPWAKSLLEGHSLFSRCRSRSEGADAHQAYTLKAVGTLACHSRVGYREWEHRVPHTAQPYSQWRTWSAALKLGKSWSKRQSHRRWFNAAVGSKWGDTFPV